MSILKSKGSFDGINPTALTSSAALNGHFQAVKYLSTTTTKSLTESEDSKSQDEITNYHLGHNAAASGNLKLLKWVLKNTKCDVTEQDEEGLTVLHVACLTGHMKVIVWLLRSTHISPVGRTFEGATALHFAAWSGQTEIVSYVLEVEPRLLNMRMTSGATAAMFASQCGYIDIMELLYELGANFGLPTNEGVNCLHVAAQQGHLDAVTWLTGQTGLSANCSDEHGATPVHYAAISGQHRIVAWLLEKDIGLLRDRFGDTAFHSVAAGAAASADQSSGERADALETVRQLVKKQSESVSARNGSGLTALDIVQDRLSQLFSAQGQDEVANDRPDLKQDTDDKDMCKISINALLLLQSSLSELRNHYQSIVKNLYHCSNTCQSTQTNDERRPSSADLISIFNSQDHDKIGCSLVARQSQDTSKMPIPPAPPLPTMIPADPSKTAETFITKIRERKVDENSSSRRRGSSTGTDIRTSLIHELKQMNNIRSRRQAGEDDESMTSANEDTFTLGTKSPSSTIKSSVTESTPNLMSLFTGQRGCPSDSGTSMSNDKESTDVIPPWKKEIMDRKQMTSFSIKSRLQEPVSSSDIANGNKNDLQDDGNSAVQGQQPKSKVSLLVNQWQNNFTPP